MSICEFVCDKNLEIQKIQKKAPKISKKNQKIPRISKNKK
jgi:hypothetical protein